MPSFRVFLERLRAIADPRRQEGRLCELPYVLLFSIRAIETDVVSYRGIHTFIKTHRVRLSETFGLSGVHPLHAWKSLSHIISFFDGR